MKCRTKFCRGHAEPVKWHSPYCPKCISRRWKQAHPITYAFHKLKCRAKERGHEFTLSIAKFTELWHAGLGSLRGKTAQSMSINRIQNWRGYHDDNVEFKTLSENSRLRFVPYFKDKAQEAAEIAETEKKVAEMMIGGGFDNP